MAPFGRPYATVNWSAIIKIAYLVPFLSWWRYLYYNVATPTQHGESATIRPKCKCKCQFI